MSEYWWVMAVVEVKYVNVIIFNFQTPYDYYI